jgi:hypothetical protein
MNDSVLLEHLEEIAGRLGVQLRYEDLGKGGIRTEGGFCRVCGKPMIFLNRRESRRKNIAVLAKSLKKLDLEGIFIPPAVRTMIENKSN